MLVVLINESEGKAWKRTRRVLAKYLPQIGSRVWAGHISEEGLKDLHQEIKKVVSKSGSVVCHRMTGRNRMEMQWIAGQKSFYDEQGRYAFRTLQATKDFSTQPQGPYDELLYLARCLAALLHDIGKATQAFQGKMLDVYHHEEYRHDLVGFLMLRSRFAQDDRPQDSVFLAELEQQTDLWPDPNALFLLLDKKPNLENKQLAAWLQEAPIFTLISWLVLTHHRLPDGLSKIEAEATHVNSLKSEFKVAPKETSQLAANGTLPWQDTTWKSHLASCAKKIAELLQTYPDLRTDIKNQTGDWILANVHFNRPLLIAADHLASIQCDHSGIERKIQYSCISETNAYANTYKYKQADYWGDTVTQHLRRVEIVSRKLKTLLQNTRHFRHATLPVDSLARVTITKPEYRWQQLLAEAAQQNLEHRPVFAAILAETGSGKTLAGVRLLDAISQRNEQGEPQLRYTLALGLRALTLQSGTALRNQACIHEKDFATLVGGLVLNIDQQPAFDDFKGYQGSENAKQAEPDGYIEGGLSHKKLNPDAMPWLDCLDAHMKGDKVGKRDRQALFEVVHDWLGERGLRLLDTPIVACTVDHIVPATHATSGGDARMALRIFTSDLVLDEIDNYSAQDLITLGKLCFMVGLAGRHVVLMSATMSPFVVQGLFDAWWRGLSIKAKIDAPGFNDITPPNSHARLIFASNQLGAEVQCHDLQTSVGFSLKALYGAYVERVCQSISSENARRREMDLYPLTALVQADDKNNHLQGRIYPEILAACQKLHQDNAQSINDLKVSVGFIRFNTAKQAWLYSRWLLQRDSSQDSYTYRIVCYHAKHPRLVLGLMDEKLNQLNNRKDINWQNLPELKTAIAATQAAGHHHLLVIVVTTTLQETGRDHDYDWTVLEPRSVRGEVQAAGRVRRHRPGANKNTNVLIMSQPLRAFDVRYDAEENKFVDSNNIFLWGRPGIEAQFAPVCKPVFNDVDNVLRNYFDMIEVFTTLQIEHEEGDAEKVDLAIDALPIEFWREKGLNSSLCLLPPDNYDNNPIGTLEHVYIHVNLNREYDDSANATKQSLNAYLTRKPNTYTLPLTKKHYTLNRFRENMTKSATVYCCEAANLETLFEKFYQPDNNGQLSRLHNVNIEPLTDIDIKKLLFHQIKEDVIMHFDHSPPYKPQDALFCELAYFGDNIDQKAIQYHWALGYRVI